MDIIPTVEVRAEKHLAQAYIPIDTEHGCTAVVVFEMEDGTFKAAFSYMFGDIPLADRPHASGLESLRAAEDWAHKTCKERGVATRRMGEMSFAHSTMTVDTPTVSSDGTS